MHESLKKEVKVRPRNSPGIGTQINLNFQTDGGHIF